MNSEQPIIVVVVCDNHLVAMLSSLLKSIEDSHHSGESIAVYIVNDAIKQKNVEKINRTLSSANINLVWVSRQQAIPRSVKLPKESTIFPLNTYVRLFMDNFLPAGTERAIYLDVDMIVIRDISVLWNSFNERHALAAVVDREIQTVSCPAHGLLNYKDLKIDPNSKYFNSGLLIVNVSRWKEIGAAMKIIDAIDENIEFARYPDQYGLNLVFANNWQELDPRWNSFASYEINDPFIVHYISIKPLYKGYYFSNKYRDLFYEVLQKTPWKKMQAQPDIVWKYNRLKTVISKKSNREIFNKITSKILGRLITR